MKIEKIIDFQMDQNCYLVHNETDGFLIDPGDCADKIIAKIKECNVNVSVVLLTHCHYDHIIGLRKLKEHYPLEIWCSEECSENLKSPVTNVSLMFSDSYQIPGADRILKDGEVFQLIGEDITCIKTPGHTNGSVCYQIGNSLFTGDTLFLRTVGRWDLPTGNYQQLEKTLKEKLYLMDDELKIYSGHGHDTTIGYEKNFNLSIKGL